MTKYGREEILVDGGIICNNPAYYAYQMATSFNGVTKKIRVLSLGTGELPFSKIDAKKVDVYTFIKKKGEFMINMDVYSAHYALKTLFKSRPSDYIRL